MPHTHLLLVPLLPIAVIGADAVQAMQNDDFESVIAAREKVLSEEIHKHIESSVRSRDS